MQENSSLEKKPENEEQEKAEAAVVKDKATFSFSWIAIVVRGIVGTCVSIFVYTQANRFENENAMGQFLALSEAHYEAVQNNLKVFENELHSLAYYVLHDKNFGNTVFPEMLQAHIHTFPFTDSLTFINGANSESALDSSENKIFHETISEKTPKAILSKRKGKDTKIVVFFPVLQGGKASGAIQGVIDLHSLLLFNLVGDKKNAMNMVIYEKKGMQTSLASLYDAELETPLQPTDTLDKLVLNDFRKDYSIHYLGIDLYIVYNATSEFIAHSWQPIIAASTGVLITTFIVVTAWILLEIEKRQFSHILHEEHVIDMEGTMGQLEVAKHRLVAQEQLASLGGLTAGIAHEIKNPLNFINNFSTLSLDLMDTIDEITNKAKAAIGEQDQEELSDTMKTLRENIATIYEQGKKADNTIQRMLAHSRGQTGEWVEQDVHNLLEEYINLSYHGMRAKNVNFNVQIKKHFDPSVKTVTVVVNDIGRVLLNLLNNAMQAVEEKRRKIEKEGGSYNPTVMITTQNLGNFIRIWVWDNGIGIKEENRSKIFTPFFTTKPAGVGTGLGLSISYNVVTREHSGSLTFDSKENEYSEFVITIPKKIKQE